MKRFDIKGLARQVASGQGQQVKDFLESCVGEKTHLQVYNAYRCVRQALLRMPESRIPGAFENILLISNLNVDDYNRLNGLLDKPLSRQHWALAVKKRFIENEEARSTRIVKPYFYAFQLSPEIIQCAMKESRADILLHHSHKKRGDWVRSLTDLEAMRKEATNFMETANLPWSTSRSACLKMLDALCLVTGRRKWELYSTLKMRCIPNESHQAEIRGLSKVLTAEDVWRTVPLLAPYELIVKSIVKLRSYKKIKPGSYGGTGLFPGMTHTAYRNYFADTAYAERETVNHFLLEGMSPTLWKSHALAVSFTALTNHYSVMTTTGK